MNIKDFKAQNPDYASVPDQDLADALYRKYYAQTGMTRADFYQRADVEVTNPENAPPVGKGPGDVMRQIAPGIWRGLGQVKDAIADVPLAVANFALNNHVAPAVQFLDSPDQLAGRMADGQPVTGAADVRPAYRSALEPLEQSGIGRLVNQADRGAGEYLGNAPDPTSGAERIAARGGEIVGSTVPFAAIPYAIGARLPITYANTPANASTAVGQVGQNMVKGAMNAPVRTAAIEAGYGAAAGLGGGVGQEIGGDTGELAGSFMLPMGLAAASVLSPTFAAGRAMSALAPTVSDAAATSRAREMVGRTIGEEMPRYQAGVERANQVEAAVNEAASRAGVPDRMNLSLAERTGSPALIAAQRDLDDGISGPTLEAARKRREAQGGAINAFAGVNAPASALTTEDVVARALVRSRDINANISQKSAEIAAEREILAGNVPSADLVEAGAALRGALDDTRRAVRDHFNQRALVEGLNDADVSLDFRAFQGRVAEAYAPRTFDNPSYRPRVLNAILDYGAEAAPQQTIRGQAEALFNKNEPRPKSQPVTFQDVKTLRERIVDDLLVSQKSSNPVDRMHEATLSRLLRDFDNFIINSELRGMDPKLADRWNAYRKDYKTQYIDQFRQPDVRSFGARDNEGFKKLANEAVAADLWQPGNITGLRSYVSALQVVDPASPEFIRGMEALEGVALDSLRKAAVRDGVIDPRRFNTWVRQHESMLGEMPYLRSVVGNLGMANQRMIARQATLADRAKVVERNIMERRLNAIEGGSRSADSLIDEAVRNPGVAERLRSRLRGDQEAIAGLRAAVWERIPFENPADTVAFLDSNAKSLGVLFTPEHLQNARFIAEARAMADRLPMPGGAAPAQVPLRELEDKLGMKLPQVGTRLYAMQSGRVGKVYPMMEGALNFVRARTKKQMDALWQRALFDPEVAQDLAATMKNPDPLTLRKLAEKTFRFGVGIEPDRPNAWVAGGAFNAVNDDVLNDDQKKLVNGRRSPPADPILTNSQRVILEAVEAR